MRELTRLDEAMVRAGWIPVPLAAEKMRLDEATVYRLLDAGALKGTRAGHRRYVSARSCVEHLGPEASKALGLVPGG